MATSATQPDQQPEQQMPDNPDQPQQQDEPHQPPLQDFVRCPYNMNHNVRFDRIQYHLMKCKKNYPDADFTICPFNASHHIPRINMDSHIKNCPNRPKRKEFSNQNFQDPNQDWYGKHIVFGSSLIPYEGDPDFPESFSENVKVNPSSSLSGLGRGSVNHSVKNVTSASSGETKLDNTKLERDFEASFKKQHYEKSFQNKEGSKLSARLVGLNRAQLIQIVQEKRINSSK
jgi:hypothetical protein